MVWLHLLAKSLQYFNAMKINLSKGIKIILGFILWPIIIAIPQFNYHYSTGLLNGQLEFGEMPVELYLGLISGLFAALLVWGIGLIIALVTNSIKKEGNYKGSSTFFIITIVFFLLMLFTQGGNFYKTLTLEEDKVMESREKIKEYRMNNTH